MLRLCPPRLTIGALLLRLSLGGLLVFVVISHAAPVVAAEISIVQKTQVSYDGIKGQEKHVCSTISIKGEIVYSDSMRFNEVVEQFIDGVNDQKLCWYDEVEVNSDGGNLLAAVQIGDRSRA